GGFFIIRAKAGMNPQVYEAFREDGKRLRSLRNKPLQTIHPKLPKRQRVELRVQWDVDGCPWVCASSSAGIAGRSAAAICSRTCRRSVTRSTRSAELRNGEGQWNCWSRSGNCTPLCMPLIPKRSLSSKD